MVIKFFHALRLSLVCGWFGSSFLSLSAARRPCVNRAFLSLCALLLRLRQSLCRWAHSAWLMWTFPRPDLTGCGACSSTWKGASVTTTRKFFLRFRWVLPLSVGLVVRCQACVRTSDEVLRERVHGRAAVVPGSTIHSGSAILRRAAELGSVELS